MVSLYAETLRCIAERYPFVLMGAACPLVPGSSNAEHHGCPSGFLVRASYGRLDVPASTSESLSDGAQFHAQRNASLPATAGLRIATSAHDGTHGSGSAHGTSAVRPTRALAIANDASGRHDAAAANGNGSDAGRREQVF